MSVASTIPVLTDFSVRLIAWQREHGRHDLPWQNTRDAYRIWLSEIMLQQTQVSTVIPYYAKFLARFPDVASLAAAPTDDLEDYVGDERDRRHDEPDDEDWNDVCHTCSTDDRPVG